jgi:hypothetical protein
MVQESRLESTLGRGGAHTSLLFSVDIIFALKKYKSKEFEVAMAETQAPHHEGNSDDVGGHTEGSVNRASRRASTPHERPRVENNNIGARVHNRRLDARIHGELNGNATSVEQGARARIASEYNEELSENIEERIGSRKYQMLQDMVSLLHDVLENEISPPELINFLNAHVHNLNQLLQPVDDNSP